MSMALVGAMGGSNRRQFAYLDSFYATEGGGGSVSTFNDVPFGKESNSRILVIAAAVRAANAPDVSINGGASLTPLISATGASTGTPCHTRIFAATGISGESGTIAVNAGAGGHRGISVYRLVLFDSSVPEWTISEGASGGNFSTSKSFEKKGVTIACAARESSGDTLSLVGVQEDSAQSLGNPFFSRLVFGSEQHPASGADAFGFTMSGSAPRAYVAAHFY